MGILKKISLIILTGLLVLAVGLAGNLDHDEYIEVNSTPKPQMWRGE